jgi:hypothetical protein
MNEYFIACSAMSFYGALCFAFIGVYKQNKDRR